MSVHQTSATKQLANIQKLIQSGQFHQAEKLAADLLNTTSNADTLTSCWYLIAVGRRLQKQYPSAISALLSLLKITPQHARAQQELGYNHRLLGELQKASVHFYKATQLNPALLSAWQALLPIYQQQKQTKAQAMCEERIKRLSALPKQLLSASDLLHDGKLADADIVCRQYLQENKHSLDGLLLLAEIAVQLKALTEAEFILETCIELAPQSAEAKYQLFTIYSKFGKFAKALALSEALLELDANNRYYKVAHAMALVGVSEIEKAISIFEQLIEHKQGEANVYLQLGHAYKTKGDIQAAVRAYKNAYEVSEHCGDAYWSLANTKTYSFTQNEIKNMHSAVKDDSVSLSDKVHFHFALGKSYEDSKNFSASFSHYEQGNKLQKSSLSFSSTKHTQFIESQINAFTPDLVAKLSEYGHTDNAPIFIVGMPRAGSTLLEQILASHSQVDGTMELHEILGLAATLSKKQSNKPVYPDNLALIPPEYFAEFGKKFISDTLIYRQGGAYFIDKMPNNYMHIGLIKLILPKAKIIDARRDPMACCFSGFKQLFGEGQEFSYSLDDIGQYYDNYVRLMTHWNAVFPEQILLVEHADVVNDTETQVRRILDFCGLEFEQGCLDFHKNKRAVKTPSAQQVRQPIYTSGLEQWKNFEPYLGPLSARFVKQ